MRASRTFGGLLRSLARLALALAMVVAGISHFTAHREFLGQVPAWLPFRSVIVWGSGVVEVAFGVALVALPHRRREVGVALALFFVLVFPGNVYQAAAGTSSFGLDTPQERIIRLFFQPLLVVWALWSTGAWPRRR